MSEMNWNRMLDKSNIPTLVDIEAFISVESMERLSLFEKQLENNYTLKRELKFPFGNNYGWGYKYSHKSKHLCYAFFEKNAFTVTLQLGDKSVEMIEDKFPTFRNKTKELWEHRYPCGEHGGWIHYKVFEEIELADIVALIETKVKPISK